MFIKCLLLLASIPVLAQNKIDTLETVQVSATQLKTETAEASFAVSVLDKYRLQTATQQLSPYESLGAVAGVFAMNPDNFSQDLRISIRGFGARASFGIRGIRVFVDGLPEGTPDGQVDVDNLDMGLVRHMEVLRGTTSGLYGNASGGVIYMLTENAAVGKTLAEAQIQAGAYGFRRIQAKFGQGFERFNYLCNISHNQTKGFRAWSNMKNTILNGKINFQLKSKTNLSLLANYGNSPMANDAGALTATQISDNPSQAFTNNVLYEVGESVQQSRIGATLDHQVGATSSLHAKVFLTNRHFQNRLAILGTGFGDLKRQYAGLNVGYSYQNKQAKMPYRLRIGFDWQQQADNRQRFSYKKITENNLSTYVQDKQVLNQNESFETIGAYILQDFKPNPRFLLSLSGRFDAMNIGLQDMFLSDGDQSSIIHYRKFNPLAGFSYEIRKKSRIYGNVGTSFETPTLNELSNNPEGKGGFNPNLKPQTAQSIEIGNKTTLKRISWDIALFRIETTNDLVPYQIVGQTGKTFYRNAGKTERKGVEFSGSWQIAKGLNVYLAQTFSDFKYKSYSVNTNNFDGKTMAGIPTKYNQVEMRYFAKNGFFCILQNRNVGKIYANDANTATANAYSVFNIRAGKNIKFKVFEVEVFGGVNNLSNTNYMANVQINAQAERFFEPAATRHAFGGLKWVW